MNKYYELAKEKGFHDNDEFNEHGEPTPRQMLVWWALIVSEVVEYELEEHPYYEVDGKPEGYIVEMSDAIIRCYDAIGACGRVPIGDIVSHSPDEWLHLAVESARDGYVDGFVRGLSGYIHHVLETSRAWDHCAMTLERAIELKHAYNTTRPRMHGRKA